MTPDRILPPTWPPGYPSHRPLTAQEARNLDEQASSEHGLPPLALMEHAARGVACLAEALAAERGGPEGAILVLCGPGNNGGDGYGAARFLRSWGRSVRLLRCARTPPRTADARLEAALAEADGSAEDAWERPELLQEALEAVPAVVIDALLGIGLDGSRPLQEPYLTWIRAVNAAATCRLSVDVPSGLDAETGRAWPLCVRADVTATMVAPKLGFASASASCGHVVEVDIGLPRALHGPYIL